MTQCNGWNYRSDGSFEKATRCKQEPLPEMIMCHEHADRESLRLNILHLAKERDELREKYAQLESDYEELKSKYDRLNRMGERKQPRMGTCRNCALSYDDGYPCDRINHCRREYPICEYFLCEACDNTGWYGDTGPGIEGNNEYGKCDCCKTVDDYKAELRKRLEEGGE